MSAPARLPEGILAEPTMTSVRGRFAPSPTGGLHEGHARTALVAWLSARATGGRFVLRIEDIDRQRSRAVHERAQLAQLAWLGLDWDEGPDVGGPHGPYRQSERGELYAAALAQLPTYPCSCTRAELRALPSAPHGAEPRYPGTCRAGPARPGGPCATRWRIPAQVVTVEDEVQGVITQDLDREVGDVVLRRADGAWAYQLAVAVDDGAMAISEVVRGADLLDSTPRQVALQAALGLATPRYAHLPLVLGPDGVRLSKRHGAPDLGARREAGEDPRALVAGLAHGLGLWPDPRVLVTPRELIPGFSWAAIRAAVGRADPWPIAP